MDHKTSILCLRGSVAQLVEQRTENPCVAGSIPARATCYYWTYDTPYFSNPLISTTTFDYNSLLVKGFIVKNTGLEMTTQMTTKGVSDEYRVYKSLYR